MVEHHSACSVVGSLGFISCPKRAAKTEDSHFPRAQILRQWCRAWNTLVDRAQGLKTVGACTVRNLQLI